MEKIQVLTSNTLFPTLIVAFVSFQSGLRVMWEEHRNDYHDHVRAYKAQNITVALFASRQVEFLPFPPFLDWLGRPEGVPDGKAFREASEKAYNTVGGAGPTTSRFDYRKRQLQHAVCGPTTPFSVDHTFDAAKNFREGKQVWDVVSGWTEPLTCILTRTTKCEEYLHAMEDLAHREGWEAPLVFTDNWPANKDQIEAIFGCQGRLGIFHFMKRIGDTLRQGHSEFNAAMRQLSKTIFAEDESHFEGVKQALRDGHLGGKKHSELEITALIESGAFKKNYLKYIARKTFDASVIRSKLGLWAEEWLQKEDPETHEKLGRRGTQDALRNAYLNINNIVDCPGIEHNIPLKKRPGEKHALHQQLSTRGEKVEILHTVLGDFANGNMISTRAEGLTLEGVVRFLMKQEAKRLFHTEEGHKSDSIDHFYPWLREEANRLAAAAGFDIPYPNTKELGPDTGEKFLYEYYLAQIEREKEAGWIKAFANGARPTRCPCQACLQRRQSCVCERCTTWRTTAEGKTAMGLEVSRFSLLPLLLATATLILTHIVGAGPDRAHILDFADPGRTTRLLTERLGNPHGVTRGSTPPTDAFGMASTVDTNTSDALHGCGFDAAAAKRRRGGVRTGGSACERACDATKEKLEETSRGRRRRAGAKETGWLFHDHLSPASSQRPQQQPMHGHSEWRGARGWTVPQLQRALAQSPHDGFGDGPKYRDQKRALPPRHGLQQQGECAPEAA
jgi:hypothetical protein